MLSALFDTYVDQKPHHSIRLVHVLVVLIVTTFTFSAVSIAYSAGRQSGPDRPTTVEVAPVAG